MTNLWWFLEYRDGAGSTRAVQLEARDFDAAGREAQARWNALPKRQLVAGGHIYPNTPQLVGRLSLEEKC